VNNKSHISSHAYVVLEIGKKNPILLNLERIVDGGTFNNLIPMIVHSFFIFGGLLKANIINEFVYFGANIVIMF